MAFDDRYWFIGPVVWALAIEYYVIQVVVAGAWPKPYSFVENTISDLGSTTRLPSGALRSPDYAVMNVAFIVLGAVMVAGAPLLFQEFRERRRRLAAAGFVCVAIAGLGTIAVGLDPVNLRPVLHKAGALCPFLIGNVALIILALALDELPEPLRWYTGLSGAVALIFAPFFAFHSALGVPEGLTERCVAYPQTCWLVVFGGYMFKKRYVERARRGG